MQVELNFDMEGVLDMTIIIHEHLGAAYTLFNVHGIARPFFIAQMKGHHFKRYVNIEVE